MTEPRRRALLMYCQHSLGLGHLRRSWAIASALSRDFHVVLLNGGAPVSGLSAPVGIEEIQLPPLAQEVGGPLISLDPSLSVAEAQEKRARTIMDVFRRTDPAAVVIEMFPFGRKKFTGELLPLLEESRSAPRRLVVCSLRDVLVRSRDGQQKYEDRAAALVNDYFDAVLVHADPSFVRLEDTFHPDTPLQVPVHYTGFVAPVRERAIAGTPSSANVVVSAGGGRYGDALFDAALAARARLASAGRTLTIVAGPLCSESTWARLAAATASLPDVTLLRTVPDMYPLMANAAVSISQCGYNTVMDLLQARVPAVVVPFAEGHEDEQMNRARRLERLGIVQVLDAADLSGETLASAIETAVRMRPAAIHLDVDGGARTSALLSAMLEERAAYAAVASAGHA